MWHRLGASGASHGGLGGAGACGGFVTCRLKRNLPYGSVYIPAAFGSGGSGPLGGSGQWVHSECVLVSKEWCMENAHQIISLRFFHTLQKLY